MIRKRWVAVFLLAGLVAGFALAASAGTEDVPRMTKEALKAMAGNPDLVLLDVRRGKDWDASEFKIKGAVREDPEKFDAWKSKLPKEKTIVLYCA
jgi:predicted sulfurtransferase